MPESEPTVLVVKHLPSELTVEDREELLTIFGAKKVRCMPDKGKLKCIAFATFETHEEAKHALTKLHQLEILNQRLVVEYAKKQFEHEFPKQSDFPPFKLPKESERPVSKSSDKDELRDEAEAFSRRLHGVCPALGLDYLPSPLLKYKYPPPSPSIIANISHALAAVPKFYTQVLHLMNKMNLPAPFGPVTPAAPLVQDHPVVQQSRSFESQEPDKIQVEEMDTSSEEESELESEEDERDRRPDVVPPAKRPLKKISKQPKRPKLHQLLPTAPSLTAKNTEPRAEPSDVFEIQPHSDQKKIQFNIKQSLNVEHAPPSSQNIEVTEGGFGLIHTQKVNRTGNDSEEEESEEEWTSSDFVTLKELRRKRISQNEMRTVSAFRNYIPGEPTLRLYIKNLARQVEEKDLRYIFGRFIDHNSETDKSMFDIRLMKEGRMKGQAFVTFANEKQAMAAVKETNGFVLHTKPLVVQFARSAKPKDDAGKNHLGAKRA